MLTSRTGGYSIWTDKDTGKTQQERDTVKCVHCQRIIHVKPGTGATVYLFPIAGLPQHLWKEEPGAFCRNCMAPVCPRCDAIGTCDRGSAHFMREIDRLEAKQRMVDAIVNARV